MLTAALHTIYVIIEHNDPDKLWRIMYLTAAAMCCDDDKTSAVTAMEYADKGG